MHATPLPDLLVLLTAAVFTVAAFRALRASPVLGYLVAGALIGPQGFAVIDDLSSAATIAEFGIVFLLFMIGLELSFDRLKAMRSQVFGVGGMQMALTGLLIYGVAKLMGMSTPAALIIGGGLALSSTALVLQVLEQRRELASQPGRLSLAILILQDLAVLPLLVLVPALAQGDGASLGATLGISALRGIAVLAVIIVVGRLLLRPLFRVIAQLDIHELFVATTLLVVFGIAWITESVGLSMALGAFIAGLLVAETEFQHQIEADVRPYKSLLMGLFFMTVGMKIDSGFILHHAATVLLGSLALIALKSTVLYAVLRAFRYSKRSSAHTSLLLSQGGEFGFILFGLAGQFGLLDASITKQLLLMIAITMALTPLLDTLGNQFERRWRRRVRGTPEQMAQESRDLAGHVVIAGYGRLGALMASQLAQEKVPFMVLDTNPRQVAAGRKNNHPVYYGDAGKPEIVQSMGIDRARALVITLHDMAGAHRLLETVRSNNPALPVFIRANDNAQRLQFENMGAAYAVPELELGGRRLIAGLLAGLGWPEEEIRRVVARI